MPGTVTEHATTTHRGQLAGYTDLLPPLLFPYVTRQRHESSAHAAAFWHELKDAATG
jgi:hypothetical protein